MIKTNAIIYHPNLAPRFADYGIPVPLGASRSTLIWSELEKKYKDLKPVDLEDLPTMTWQDVALAHDLDFIARLLDKQFVSNEVAQCFELSNYKIIEKKKPLELMPQDVLEQCRGTHLAALIALKENVSFFLGGGMHHAMSFAGRGFCLLNDVVVSARKLQRDEGVKNILVIDVDVHKGDGSAQMTCHDDSISTLSIHMKDGWPLDGSLGPGPWDIASTLDVPIAIGEESLYINKLAHALTAIDLSRFDFAYIVLGADPWEHDQLISSSGIKLTLEQMLERDLLLEETLQKASLPHTYVMGGGYGPNAHIPYVQFIEKLLD